MMEENEAKHWHAGCWHVIVKLTCDINRTCVNHLFFFFFYNKYN